MEVPMTDKEREALDELARMQELKPERVMIQALRLYQMVAKGGATVRFPADEKMKAAAVSLLEDIRDGKPLYDKYVYDHAEMDNLQDDIGQWGDKTFGKSTLTSVLTHLKKEVVELDRAIDHYAMIPTDAYGENVLEEAADIAMMLFHIAHKVNGSLADAIEAKFKECRGRKWGEPDAEGVVEHIRE